MTSTGEQKTTGAGRPGSAPLRVVLVAPFFHPDVGGVENYVLNMALRLRRLGQDVAVVTTSGRLGIRIRRDVAAGISVYRLDHLLKVSNTRISPLWWWQVARVLAWERPDVVNGHTPVPFLADVAQRAAGPTPFVLTYHNDVTKASGPLRLVAAVVNRLLVGPTLAGSDAVITTSSQYVELSPYLRAHRDRIRQVAPGVDLDRFHPGVDASGITARYRGRPVVAFVASLRRTHAHKGLPVLLEAFARLPPDEARPVLVVVGDGDARAQYERRARELGIAADVDFVGRVSDEDLARYYRAASVFVLPSTDTSEGFGMVLLEAGACSTAVIGSAVGGIPVAIDEGVTGLLVPPRDADALAAALQALLDDRDLREKLAAGGVEKARRQHDWDVLAGDYLAVLAGAAGGHTSG